MAHVHDPDIRPGDDASDPAGERTGDSSGEAEMTALAEEDDAAGRDPGAG